MVQLVYAPFYVGEQQTLDVQLLLKQTTPLFYFFSGIGLIQILETDLTEWTEQWTASKHLHNTHSAMSVTYSIKITQKFSGHCGVIFSMYIL